MYINDDEFEDEILVVEQTELPLSVDSISQHDDQQERDNLESPDYSKCRLVSVPLFDILDQS